MADLLSIAAARAAVLRRGAPLGTDELPVEQALGRLLAEDVTAATDVPAFANSAMDGFAVRSGPAGRKLRLVGESRAGVPFAGAVRDGEAVRISTGAAVPDGAHAVLQLELAREDAGDAAVTLEDDVAPGRNLRPAGSDMPAGELVVPAGTRLGPAE